MLASNDTGEPSRDAPRRLRVQHRRERRQPLPHRGRLVIDDVVDAWCSTLYGDRTGSLALAAAGSMCKNDRQPLPSPISGTR